MKGVPLLRGAGVCPVGFTRNFFRTTNFCLKTIPLFTRKHTHNYVNASVFPKKSIDYTISIIVQVI